MIDTLTCHAQTARNQAEYCLEQAVACVGTVSRFNPAWWEAEAAKDLERAEWYESRIGLEMRREQEAQQAA